MEVCLGIVIFAYFAILISEIKSKFTYEDSILERLGFKNFFRRLDIFLKIPSEASDGERLEVDDDGNFTIHKKDFTTTKGNIYKDKDILLRHGYRTTRINKGEKYDNEEIENWVKRKD